VLENVKRRKGNIVLSVFKYLKVNKKITSPTIFSSCINIKKLKLLISINLKKYNIVEENIPDLNSGSSS
jgi:hypothetical protein